MQFKLFQIPLPATGDLEELNQFLASQRIATASHHVVAHSAGTMLVFVVEYVDSAPQSSSGRPPKVDYREVLSPEDFTVFDALRVLRKQFSEKDGVPVYAIFSNAHPNYRNQ